MRGGTGGWSRALYFAHCIFYPSHFPGRASQHDPMFETPEPDSHTNHKPPTRS